VSVEAADIRLSADVEERHWWYRERRRIIAAELRRLRPGRAIEIGAAGGGNSMVLREHGWQVLATEYLAEGADIARNRGLTAIRADARHLPVRDGAFDLFLAFDVLEHIQEDDEVTAEMYRTLRPGGTALIAVPCDMALWSAHDVASGHVRRYTRQTLTEVVDKSGLVIDDLWSWNVLLRPLIAMRRRSTTGNDVTRVNPIVNAGLTAVVAAERHLPVKSLPGVSLMLRARRP
jgi:SAM-dependent methyltransferase